MRNIVALVGGVCLYFVSVVLFGGVAAAWPAPAGYFAWFGRENQDLALAVLGLVSWTLPVFLLVALGTLALHRLLRPTRTATALFSLVGMAAAFAWYALPSSAHASVAAGPALVERIGVVFAVPWWALPKVLAPWLGMFVAIWLLCRKSGHAGTPRSEA